MKHKLPVIAIVGRPNVGKSTLFNRISGTRKAVVHDLPGVTRDRNYIECELGGRPFMLIDTGGYDPDEASDIALHMREQIQIAIDEADGVIFLTDCREPHHPDDFEIAQRLRKSSKPLVLAVNKADNAEQLAHALIFAELALGDVFPVSAEHAIGVAELLEALLAQLPPGRKSETPGDVIRIAVVGRQNSGKSTLVNRILGAERVIASPVAGTTRDAIDAPFRRNGKDYLLIDTAGIRRRGRIEQGIEKLSVFSALLSIKNCDVALLLIDAAEGLTEQDAHIAGFAEEAGKLSIIAVNKWDLVAKDNSSAGAFVKNIRANLKFLQYAPVQFISAKTGEKVPKIFTLIDELLPQYRRQIPTPEVNRAIEKALKKHSPPLRGATRLKIKYAVQTGAAPPIFTLFVNNPKLLHFSYRRFLVNQLREAFRLTNVPVWIKLQKKSVEES